MFFRLRQLRPGDRIYVQHADGTLAVFRFYAEHTYAKDHFPTQKVYGPAPDPELRLITCGGVFDAALGSYLSNVVVYAAQIRYPGRPACASPERDPESRSAPTPLGNGRPVCAGIWAPSGKRPVTESPGARCPAPAFADQGSSSNLENPQTARSAVAPNSRPRSAQAHPALHHMRAVLRPGRGAGRPAGRIRVTAMWAEQPGWARRRELDPQHVWPPARGTVWICAAR